MSSRKVVEIETSLFVKFLEYIGCVEDTRTHKQKRKGGHRKFHRPGLPRPIIIQGKKKIPEMIILSNLRTLGITRDEYLDILGRLKGRTPPRQ